MKFRKSHIYYIVDLLKVGFQRTLILKKWKHGMSRIRCVAWKAIATGLQDCHGVITKRLSLFLLHMMDLHRCYNFYLQFYRFFFSNYLVDWSMSIWSSVYMSVCIGCFVYISLISTRCGKELFFIKHWFPGSPDFEDMPGHGVRTDVKSSHNLQDFSCLQ